jgi:hypothetical protein
LLTVSACRRLGLLHTGGGKRKLVTERGTTYSGQQEVGLITGSCTSVSAARAVALARKQASYLSMAVLWSQRAGRSQKAASLVSTVAGQAAAACNVIQQATQQSRPRWRYGHGTVRRESSCIVGTQALRTPRLRLRRSRAATTFKAYPLLYFRKCALSRRVEGRAEGG